MKQPLFFGVYFASSIFATGSRLPFPYSCYRKIFVPAPLTLVIYKNRSLKELLNCSGTADFLMNWLQFYRISRGLISLIVGMKAANANYSVSP